MKLISTSPLSPQGNGIIYHSQDICLFAEMTDFHAIDGDSFVIDGLAIVLLNQGKSVISVEGRTTELEQGMILVTSPHAFVNNALLSMDINISGLFVSTAFCCQLSQELHFDFTLLVTEKTNTSRPLTPRDQRLFAQYIQTLAQLYQRPDSNYNGMAVKSLMQSFGMFITELTSHPDGVSETSPYTHNSAESKVSYFLKMISQQTRNFQNVEGYAQQLCISSKYFSSICKKVTGRTAGHIINEHIIRQAKIRLSNPESSIKEIAHDLGFATHSHFGTFLRRSTGMSPQELRNSILSGANRKH